MVALLPVAIALLAVLALVLGPTLLGIASTSVGIVRSLVLHKPFRVDIPFPGLPIDFVMVTELDQVETFLRAPEIGRIHSLPTDKIPRWLSGYFAATGFHDDRTDSWFVAFEPETKESNYTARIESLRSALATGYRQEEVHKVAELIQSGADELTIAKYVASVVNSRFVGGKPVPEEIVESSTKICHTVVDALKPGYYKKALAAARHVADFTTEHMSVPPDQLNPKDVAHNIGATTNGFVSAFTILKKSLHTPIHDLFTLASSCPAPAVPRIAVGASTFGGHLAYPSVPGKTFFFIGNSKIAEANKDILYAFGTGPKRSCVFRPFFESFIGDLQKVLIEGAKPDPSK